MIRLVRSELLRIRSRRLVWILAVLALVGIVVGVGIGAVKSHKPTPAQVARADRVFARSMKACLNGDTVKEARLPEGQTLESYCADTVQRSDVVIASGTVLQLGGLVDILKGTSFLLLVIGLVIGASSVGADWQSGSMATLLTWEPRRLRVLLIRTLVVMAAVFVLALILQLALALAMTLAATLRGISATPTGFRSDVTQVILRVAVVAAVASSIGVAISSIGRGTAAALGVIFVYLALVESLLHGLVPRLAPWLLGVNLAAFVDGRTQDLGRGQAVSLLHGVVVVGAYGMILMVLALVFFRSRDVT